LRTQPPLTILAVGSGSLYPASHRLEREGWAEAEWWTNEATGASNFAQLRKKAVNARA
jgi:DNA-binding PadR family transcriptional regulator